LLSLKDRRVLVAQGSLVAQRWLIYPGSTIKPFSLLALCESGKLTNSDLFVCPQKLSIAGRVLNCSHPPVATPMNVSRALSYSCNCAVAHFAQRFGPSELPGFLTRMGFESTTRILPGPEVAGVADRLPSKEESLLQALGEAHIRITALELLNAYAKLARRVDDTIASPIIEGLEGAVTFGTAQRVQLKRIKVAAKTGSVQVSPGLRAAWLAGFAPSSKPEIVFTVLVQGRSGGADAAPVASRFLSTYFGETA
jgi:cell division protein FtsI/penicillin-binding protein 2